jgi:hypothetical protein
MIRAKNLPFALKTKKMLIFREKLRGNPQGKKGF